MSGTGRGCRLPSARLPGPLPAWHPSGHSVGENVVNSIKSHNHTQPTHTHSFSGQLVVSTALTGTAAGQSFSSATSLEISGWAAGQAITSGGADGQSFSYQGSTTGGSGGYVTFRHDSGTTSGGNGAGGVVPGYSATPPASSGLPWETTITENHGIVYSKYSDGSGDEKHTVTNSYVPFSGGRDANIGWRNVRRFNLGQYERRRDFWYG